MPGKSHIAVAAVDGPKAGLRAYIEQLSRSGLPTVQERLDTLTDMSGRKAFKWYCGQFGAQIANAQRKPAQTTRKAEPALSRRDQLLAELAELDEQESGVQVVATAPVTRKAQPKAEQKIVAKRISWPMAMALKKIATKQGSTFEITGKSGKGRTANYAIKFDGKALTPAKASTIIGASK